MATPGFVQSKGFSTEYENLIPEDKIFFNTENEGVKWNNVSALMAGKSLASRFIIILRLKRLSTQNHQDLQFHCGGMKTHHRKTARLYRFLL